MSARVLCHMDASDTIIYVSQKAQTVPGKGKTTLVGIPCVRPQSDMRCYRLDRYDLESGSPQGGPELCVGGSKETGDRDTVFTQVWALLKEVIPYILLD